MRHFHRPLVSSREIAIAIGIAIAIDSEPNDSREAPLETARVHRRCLASRHVVVLNIMAACLASSRGSASPEPGHGDGCLSPGILLP